MKFISSRLGEIEYDPNKVIYFPLGIPGFDKFKRYILLSKENFPYFLFLHSVENKDLMFILTDPFIFVKDYSFKLSDDDIYFLEIKNKFDIGKNILIFSIVTIREKIKNFSLNLKAPILINIEKKIGKQVILYNDNYPIRFHFDFSDKSEKVNNPIFNKITNLNTSF